MVVQEICAVLLSIDTPEACRDLDLSFALRILLLEITWHIVLSNYSYQMQIYDNFLSFAKKILGIGVRGCFIRVFRGISGSLKIYFDPRWGNCVFLFNHWFSRIFTDFCYAVLGSFFNLWFYWFYWFLLRMGEVRALVWLQLNQENQ